MKILKILATLLFTATYIFASSVETKVSSNRVSEGQKLVVKIVAGSDKAIFPKIDNIDGVSVENVRESMKSQMKIENGTVTKRKEKILIFELYPDKNITIPAFQVDIDGEIKSTNPISIEVVKGGKKSPTGGFKISMKVDKKSLFVGEPMILKVDVVEPDGGVRVNQLNYIPPEFKNLFAKQIGKEEVSKRDGKIIHQLKYLLIPQKDGKVIIPPARLKVGIEDVNAPADPFGLFGSPIKWHSLRAKSIEVDVKSPPKDIDLIGNFRVDAKINRKKTKPNQPINYTLTIKGEGSLDDLEDPVFDIPNVTVYSDNAVVKSRLDGDKLVSIYQKKYVFISDRSFRIPEIEFKEFDYTTRRKKLLKSPSFDVEIAGVAAPRPNLANGASNGQNPRAYRQQFDNNGSILEDSVYYAKKEYEEKEAMLPFYTLVSFFAGMMAMFALMKLFKKNKRIQNFIKKEKRVIRNHTAKEALEVLYPFTSDSPEVEEMVRKLYLVQKGKRGMQVIDREKLHKMIEHYKRDFDNRASREDDEV